jgi:hypothetical protein
LAESDREPVRDPSANRRITGSGVKRSKRRSNFTRELIRDHNRLPHWAHHRRSDGKHSPLAVLGPAKGKQADPADIQRAFGQLYCQRLTDARGFVKIGRWKIYIEEGLPRTPVQLSYWDGKLRAEYRSQILTEYQCKWEEKSSRPTIISQPLHHAHPSASGRWLCLIHCGSGIQWSWPHRVFKDRRENRRQPNS